MGRALACVTKKAARTKAELELRLNNLTRVLDLIGFNNIDQLSADTEMAEAVGQTAGDRMRVLAHERHYYKAQFDKALRLLEKYSTSDAKELRQIDEVVAVAQEKTTPIQ